MEIKGELVIGVSYIVHCYAGFASFVNVTSLCQQRILCARGLSATGDASQDGEDENDEDNEASDEHDNTSGIHGGCGRGNRGGHEDGKQ